MNDKSHEVKSLDIDSLYVIVKVFDLKINCLIDTGSTLSILHPSKYNAIPEKERPILSNDCGGLRLADGGILRPLGAATFPVRLANKTIFHRLIVAEIDTPMIIGFDFLNRNNCILNMGEGTIQVDGQTVDCIEEQKLNYVFKISAEVDTEIPPSCEMIVPGKISQGLPHRVTGLVNSATPILTQNGCLLAKAVVNPCDQSMPIRLVNLSDQPVKLVRETIIGQCELVDSSLLQPFNYTGAINTDGQLRKINETQNNLPDHLLELYKNSVVHLNEEQSLKVFNLLIKYQSAFSKSKSDIGRTDIVKHKIDTGDAPPFKMQPRRLPMAKREAASKEIKRLLDEGIIEPSNGPYASPIVVVTKPDQSTRLCIDYRKLNLSTKRDCYPLPLISDSLDALCDSSWFSCLDLSSGYYQVLMDPSDKEKTAFTSHEGLFQFRVMSFGLCNAVATFQRLMETVLRGLHWKTCLLYIDDVIVFANKFDTHIQRLDNVLERIAQAGLKISPKKCHFFQKQVKFLGHIVSEDGVSTDPQKVECVSNWPQPRTVHDVRSFLGTCSYYRRFIPLFSDLARPLNKLTEKGAKFVWTNDCENSFQILKEKLTQSPVLAYPCMNKPFILDTDASGYGIGAVLSQVVDGLEKPISYFSRSMNKHERNYCVTRRELLAIVESVKHFHHYLYGSSFNVRTDHGALNWLRRFKNPEGQIARWIEVLETYTFTIEHRPGKQHGNADGLSRQCFPCNHCSRQETKDDQFQYPENHVRSIHSCDEPSTSRQEPMANWLRPKSDFEVREAQINDKNLKIVIKWLEDLPERPKRSNILSFNADVKTFWGKWDQLTLENGVLYRKFYDAELNKFKNQLVIPESWRTDILQMLHDDPVSGHLGIGKTVARLQSRVYWPNIQRDVTLWCQKCLICQAKRPPVRKARGGLGQFAVGVPMERVGMDILGPLPQSRRGNKYLLVVSDYFTRWIEAYPIPDIEAKTICQVFINEFITRYGIPRQIHTDRGTQFTSLLFKEMCEVFRINKSFTTPLHPQSNGLVERFNRTIEDMLSKVVRPDQRNWDEVLPMVMLAYRTSQHESTGHTPSMMMFGREIELPIDLLLGLPPDEKPSAHAEYITNLISRLDRVHTVAADQMVVVRERQKRNYDLRINENKYEIGSLVWIYDPTSKKGLSKKLQNPWVGPYQVVETISDLIYKVQQSAHSKPKVIHHDRLKPYLC